MPSATDGIQTPGRMLMGGPTTSCLHQSKPARSSWSCCWLHAKNRYDSSSSTQTFSNVIQALTATNSCSKGAAAAVQLQSTYTAEFLWQLEGHQGPVTCVCWTRIMSQVKAGPAHVFPSLGPCSQILSSRTVDQPLRLLHDCLL